MDTTRSNSAGLIILLIALGIGVSCNLGVSDPPRYKGNFFEIFFICLFKYYRFI